jgi:hypothetical protein
MDGMRWAGAGSQARWVRAIAYLYRGHAGLPIPMIGVSPPMYCPMYNPRPVRPAAAR